MSAISNLSFEDVEKMRQIVMESDLKNKGGDLDLSKPIVNLNYRPQDNPFPAMVYDHSKAEPGSQSVKETRNGPLLIVVEAKLGQKIVRNQAELDAALEAGYQLKPPVFGSEESEAGPVDDGYAAFLQEQEAGAEESAEQPKRGRGRPRKEVSPVEVVPAV